MSEINIKGDAARAESPTGLSFRYISDSPAPASYRMYKASDAERATAAAIATAIFEFVRHDARITAADATKSRTSPLDWAWERGYAAGMLAVAELICVADADAVQAVRNDVLPLLGGARP